MDRMMHRKRVREFMARPPFLKRNIPDGELDVICTALTHDSYSNEIGMNESYERLEFLGDAVVELIVCEHIFSSTSGSEGNMTSLKQSIVSNKNMSSRLLDKGINIGDIMLVGNGHKDKVTKENNPASGMVADSFEALMGAYYILYGLEESRKVVSALLL